MKPYTYTDILIYTILKVLLSVGITLLAPIRNDLKKRVFDVSAKSACIDLAMLIFVNSH